MKKHKLLNLCLRYCAFALAMFVCTPGQAEPARRDSLQFDVKVISGVERHLAFLAYPSYLAVALENNGIKPSNTGRVKIVDGKTLQFRNALVQFIEQKGTVYRYQGRVEWDLGVKQVAFTVPAEVDTASLSSGKLTVRVYPPLAKLFPQALLDRVGLKIQTLADTEVQKKMLGYFDGLAKQNRNSEPRIDGMLNQILVEAYNGSNRQGVSCAEPGDAEPLSDQLLLFASLLIWFVVGPVFIWLYFRAKRRRLSGE